MIPFLKLGLWIFRCFVFLSFVNNSRAQRDARTPTVQELFQAGLIYASDFKMWPGKYIVISRFLI